MNSLQMILGLSENTATDEILAAYNSNHAELISRQNAGEDVSTYLQQLEMAYTEWENASIQDLSRAIISFGNEELQSRPSTPAGLFSQEEGPATEQRLCLGCGAVNPVQASICINCGRQISRSCPKCGFLIDLEQIICPRCGITVREYDQRRFAEGTMSIESIQKERDENFVRVKNLEAGHNTRAGLGVVFWVVVIIVSLFLCILATFAYQYYSAA